jgi:hypothetical protein
MQWCPLSGTPGMSIIRVWDWTVETVRDGGRECGVYGSNYTNDEIQIMTIAMSRKRDKLNKVRMIQYWNELFSIRIVDIVKVNSSKWTSSPSNKKFMRISSILGDYNLKVSMKLREHNRFSAGRKLVIDVEDSKFGFR